jgi:hypothetical protein
MLTIGADDEADAHGAPSYTLAGMTALFCRMQRGAGTDSSLGWAVR